MQAKDNQPLLIYVLFGLVIGFGIDGLFYQKITYVYPYLFLTLCGLMLALAYDTRHWLRLILTSVVIAAIVCSPFLLANSADNTEFNADYLIPVISFPLVAMIAHAFNFAYHLDNRVPIRYTSLFFAVWNTVPLLLIALLFLLIARSLITLCGGIFALFHFKTLARLLTTNSHIYIISTAALLIIGVGIARQNLKIVHSFRAVILKLFYYLYPFLMLITAIYLTLFSLALITDHLPDGAKWILAVLSVLGIVFFNAVFEDGKETLYQNTALNLAVKGHLLMLLITTLLTVYYIAPDTAKVLNAYLLFTILVLYGLSYSIAVFFRQSQSWIKGANIGIALYYLAAFLIINNPLYPLVNKVDKPSYKTRLSSSVYTKAQENKQAQQTKANDNQLSQLGFHWQENIQSKNQVQSICRARIPGSIQVVGLIKARGCAIVGNKKVSYQTHYDRLVGDNASLTWYPYIGAIPLVFGWDIVYGSVKPTMLCRAKINGQFELGVTQNNICIIIDRDKPKRRYNNYELLGLDAGQYPDKTMRQLDLNLKQAGFSFVAPPTSALFVAGINDQGPIGICRSFFNRNLQVGSYQNERCTLSDGKQVAEVSYFEVLTGNRSDHAGHWQVTNARSFNAYNHDLPLGFIATNNQGIQPLLACRAIYKNRIHLGKLISGKCHITSDGQAIEIRSGYYTVLSDKQT